MAVRNWWIEVEIDGRKEILKGGPKTKDGGFSITIYQRDNKQPLEVMHIYGDAFEDGTLQLSASLDQNVWFPGDEKLTVMSHRDEPTDRA